MIDEPTSACLIFVLKFCFGFVACGLKADETQVTHAATKIKRLEDPFRPHTGVQRAQCASGAHVLTLLKRGLGAQLQSSETQKRRRAGDIRQSLQYGERTWCRQ